MSEERKSVGAVLDGDVLARKLLGPLGVCFAGADGFVVGRYVRVPVGVPPWPIEVFGKGPTIEAAVKSAIREVEATYADSQAQP